MRSAFLCVSLAFLTTPIFATAPADCGGHFARKQLHALVTGRLEIVPKEEVLDTQIHYSVRLRGSADEIGTAQIVLGLNDEIINMGLGFDDGFLQSHPREGYGTELKTALLKFGFDELHAQIVHATIKTTNEASLRLHVRLGFLPTGQGLELVLTRERWLEVQAGRASIPSIEDFRRTRYLVATESLGERARQYCLSLIYNDLQALGWDTDIIENRTSFVGLRMLATRAHSKLSLFQSRQARKLESLLRSIEIYRAAEPLFGLGPGDDVLAVHMALDSLSRREPLEVYLLRVSPLLTMILNESMRKAEYLAMHP